MQKAAFKKQIVAKTSLSDTELQDAKQLINTLLLAWKNYGLYPEDHSSTTNAFENLVAAFGNFFKNHDDLRLTVEKDSLLCKSEIIHEVSQEAPAEDIITLLYRDGIKWIEFQEGLTIEEIASFFRIANKYRMFAEETEGDIVTALMDEELEYIDFKAVDIFWQDLLLMDFSQLSPSAPQSAEVDHQQEKDANQNTMDKSQQPAIPLSVDTSAISIADPSISNAQLELSNSDYTALQEMVKDEENWDIREDLFEVLLIILKCQTEEEKFDAVLGFISEEVVEAIERDKFDLLIKLFKSLQEFLSPKTPTQQDWRSHHIGRFFKDLSRPEIFRLISGKLLELQTNEIEKLKALYKVLHYFSPGLIPFLVPVLIKISSPKILQVVLEVIVHLSKRNLGPLEKIAEEHATEIGDKLLLILNHLQGGERVNEILFKMCDQSSDKVRRKSIRELVNRDPQYALRLFPLIDDPDRDIRTWILAACAKQQSHALENKLLNYLAENSGTKDPAHLLACYKALGRCGSNTSVPFLRKVLLSQGWNSYIGSGKLTSREGAAIALALLNTPKTIAVLQQASNSRFKVIRKAFERTKTIRGISGENSND